MPQERPNHYGHLLDQSKRADQEFLAKTRKLSPRFPNVADALERRRALRETIAARTMLFCFVAFGGWALVATDWHFPAIATGFSLLGFITICFAAGNRQYVRSGGKGGSHGRPF